MRNESKLNHGQIRQGDVLLVLVGESAEVNQNPEAVTLKEGGATGHKHQFMAESRVSFMGRTQIAVGAAEILRHEEHSPATVLPGIYDMPAQVEWTDENEPRVVAD